MVEFALIAPAFLTIVFGIIDFGLVKATQVTIINASRDGARWAGTHPTAWSSAASPATNTIEYLMIAEANNASASLTNNDATFVITYYVPGSGSAKTECGHYSVSTAAPANFSGTAPGFISASPATNGTTYTQATCVLAGNLVSVQVNTSYALQTPIRAFIPTVTISSTSYSVVEV